MGNSTTPQRDSFIFYRSFWEAIEEAAEADQLAIFKAITYFALNHEEPQDLKGLAKALWALIRPLLEANWKKFENGCKGAPHGTKGGAPKGNANASKTTPKQPQNNPKTTPNVNDNVNDNVNVLSSESKSKRKAFAAPALDEVKQFFKIQGFTSDPAAFFDHYEANGWTQGRGKPLKKWEAAARQWERRQAEFANAPRLNNGTAGQPAMTEREKRKSEFMAHIATRLTSPDDEPDISDNY